MGNASWIGRGTEREGEEKQNGQERGGKGNEEMEQSAVGGTDFVRGPRGQTLEITRVGQGGGVGQARKERESEGLTETVCVLSQPWVKPSRAHISKSS